MTRASRFAAIIAISLYLAIVLLVLLAARRVRLPLRGLRRWMRDGRPLAPPAARAPAPPADAEAGEPPARSRDELLALLRCTSCGGELAREPEALSCSCGRRFAIRRGVPRFIESDAYVDSFSFEWNAHRTTQVDSVRGDDLSERALREKTGLDSAAVRGKVVLDAGVGAGRFAEVLARWGASVIGVDLSFAVEAAHANLARAEGVLVVQADIGSLPFAPATFDAIVSIGVLHHTPDTRRYFAKLVPLLKPGGTIAIWVYPDHPDFLARKEWIPFTSRIPARAFHEWCRWFVPFAKRRLGNPLVRGLCRMFPIMWQDEVALDVLDTFDGFSPRFHGVHAPGEVERWFRAAGLVDVERLPAESAVRGRLPAPISAGAGGARG